MAADEDDDWTNEDFIATIENVVAAAEEASAARLGGTQFRASTAIPPQTINSRITGASPSMHAASLFHDFLLSQPSNGSAACPPREAYPGTSFRHGEHVNLELKGTPSFGTPHHPGQPRLPLQSVSREKSFSLAEAVPKIFHSHHSSEGVLLNGQPRGGTGGLAEESVRYRELLDEKDGAISLLRSRLKQAELQLDYLLKQVGPQSSSQPSLYQQQQDLEHLSSQLLFKDHEVTEAQRHCARKEERLKDAVSETVALKEEIEQLKKSRQTSAEFKRPRDERNVEVAENNSGSYGIAPDVPHVRVRNRGGVSQQSHDPWSPPWMPEGSLKGAQGKTTVGLTGKTSKDAPDVGTCQRLPVESPTIEALKSRTGGNGCVPSNRKDSLQDDRGQAKELPRSDIAKSAGTSVSARADAASQGLNSFSRTSEMYYSLQQLWGLKGVRNEGISLLSKLYASCKQDLYILLSHGQSQGSSSHISPHNQKERQTDGGTVSEKLHAALAEVANGFAHPEMVITPLLEFCKLDNVNLTGSALHILHCILQHDNTCRQKLLLRGSQGGPDHQVPSASCEIVEKPEKFSEGKGWFITRSSTSQMRQLPVFSSPRILCRFNVEDNYVQLASGKRDLEETGVDEGKCEPPGPSDKTHQQAHEHKLAGFGDPSVPDGEDLNPVVKWLLHLAMTTLSRNVKFEAIAIIGVLVLNCEPLVERAMFLPLLYHGGIDLLLKESAGAEIKLQAIRIVHLLLHCPIVFQRFCFVVEGDQSTMHVNKRDPEDTIHVEKQADKLPFVDGHNHEIDVGLNAEKITAVLAPQQLFNPQLSRAKLLQGMTLCLKYTANTVQRFALHRSVIRLLTFIATSGDSGAASLLQADPSHEELELGQTCKDDSKLEGVLGGESVSGQQIVGSGPRLMAHDKSLDLGDRGSGIPTSLVNESVNELERVQHIPQRLVALLDLELDIEEREGWNERNIADERDHLIREAVLLLCHLSLNAVQSPVVLKHLISNKDMARLTLSVTNRLVDRISHSQRPGAARKPAAPKNTDTAELARCLRRRVLNSLAESEQFL